MSMAEASASASRFEPSSPASTCVVRFNPLTVAAHKGVDCQLGVFRIGVSIASACRAACRPRQATGLHFCVHDARWHRPACARSRAVWTKIQTNQPLTKRCAGETYYRGQSAIPPAGDPRRALDSSHVNFPYPNSGTRRQLRRSR